MIGRQLSPNNSKKDIPENNDKSKMLKIVKARTERQTTNNSPRKPFFWAKSILYVGSTQKVNTEENNSFNYAYHSPYDSPQKRHRRLNSAYSKIPTKKSLTNRSQDYTQNNSKILESTSLISQMKLKFQEAICQSECVSPQKTCRKAKIMEKQLQSEKKEKTVYDYISEDANNGDLIKRSSLFVKNSSTLLRNINSSNSRIQRARIKKYSNSSNIRKLQVVTPAPEMSLGKEEKKEDEKPLRFASKRFLIMSKIHALNPFNNEKEGNIFHDEYNYIN